MLEKTVPGIYMAVCLPPQTANDHPYVQVVTILRRDSHLLFVEISPLVINCDCVSSRYVAHAASGCLSLNILSCSRRSAQPLSRLPPRHLEPWARTFDLRTSILFLSEQHDIPAWMLSTGSGLFLGLRQINSRQ